MRACKVFSPSQPPSPPQPNNNPSILCTLNPLTEKIRCKCKRLKQIWHHLCHCRDCCNHPVKTCKATLAVIKKERLSSPHHQSSSHFYHHSHITNRLWKSRRGQRSSCIDAPCHCCRQDCCGGYCQWTSRPNPHHHSLLLLRLACTPPSPCYVDLVY
jgi:hypothetical protein